MRSVVLVFMIALLPLRMWAADGMAIRMAHGEPPAVAAAAAQPMPADCPMAAGDAGGDAQGAGSHCASCHLCASVAGLPPVAPGLLGVLGGPPLSPLDECASASIAPDLRPPIS